MREPEDIYGNGGSSYRIVTDHISCPKCGCEMGLMEVHVGHWLNHCSNCDYTESR
jgi:ribosomal protein S27AE